MAYAQTAFTALSHDAVSVSPVAPAATITVIDGLPKTRTASPKALAFNFASLFNAGAVGAAFNDQVITQAISGRVCHQFVKLSATLGLIVPTGKAQFDNWSAAIVTDVVAPFKAHGKSVAYCAALVLIRETLGLSDVVTGAWAAPKTPKAKKAATVKTPSKATITTTPDADSDASESLDAVVDSIVASLDVLSMAQLETLQAAITLAISKVAPF